MSIYDDEDGDDEWPPILPSLDDEDENGGWAINRTHSDSIWDNSDDDENTPHAEGEKP